MRREHLKETRDDRTAGGGAFLAAALMAVLSLGCHKGVRLASAQDAMTGALPAQAQAADGAAGCVSPAVAANPSITPLPVVLPLAGPPKLPAIPGPSFTDAERVGKAEPADDRPQKRKPETAPAAEIIETPGGGLSSPLADLPLAGPPRPDHPELALDEEFIRERMKEANPNPPIPDVQYADAAPPSNLLTGDPARDARIAPLAPGTGTPPVAFADADASTTGQPPDTDMDVSDSHIVTDYNSIVKVYDKTGNLLAGPTDIQALFNSTGSMPTCGATETSSSWLSDPQVRWDEESQRWFLGMLRVTGGGTGTYLCLACSQSSDPTGSWRGWEANMGSTTIADYPHMGIGQDAVFIGSNDFNGSTGAYVNSKVTAVYPKANLLSGGTLTWNRATLANNGYTPQPVKRHGYPDQWPPSGTPHYILAVEGATTGEGQVFRWTYPTASGSLQYVNAPGFSYTDAEVNPSGTTYVQTSGRKLDSVGFRWMDAEMRWPYIWSARTLGNPGDTTCHGDGASGQDCNLIQWGQVDVSTGTPSIVQQGNYAVSGNHLFMPDVAVDSANNFAVGYTYVKDTGSVGPTYVSAYLSGRENTDPAGTLGAPLSSADGDTKVNTYNQGTAPNDRMRWGDYLSMAVDPNGCDLWFNGMRAKSGYTYNDQTYVQKFRFASCGTPYGALNQLIFGCGETVSATIGDSGGTPSGAVYHSTSGGPVPADILGGPGTFAVEPRSLAQLGAQDGDTIWMTFTDSGAVERSTALATVKCSRQVCVYAVDPLTGGCDADTYLDQGEALNVNVALANYDTSILPGPFQATLGLVTPDPNLQVFDRATGLWGDTGTMTYPALGPSTFAYGDYPFLVRYTGPVGSTCKTALTFQVTGIQALDGSWVSSGCTAGSNQFPELANADDTASLLSESFDAKKFPPSNWSRVDVSGTSGSWTRYTTSAHPAGYSPHSGAAMAGFNSWTANPGTATRFQYDVSFNFSSSTTPSVSFWMFHDTQYSNADTVSVQVSTDSGSTWTTVPGGTFYRYNGTSYAWEKHVVSLAAYAGNANVRIGFLGTSAYGNDEYIDDVAVLSGNTVCQVSTCSPAPILAYNQYAWLDGQCNGNYVIDPGESGLLVPYLANTGNDWAYGTTATLSCPSCPAGITICKSTATYGDIPYGTAYVYGPGANGFEIAVASSVACGTTLPFQLSVQATNPYGPTTLATTSYPIKVGGTAGTCTATSCGGSCVKPDAPAITAITDNAACAQDGIRVTYDAAILATGHNLMKDGTLAVTGYVSGALYDPGDTASHAYTIRAINAYGTTDSAAVAYADATAPVAAIYGATSNVCPATTVDLSTDAGYSNYQWYLGGTPIGGATSSTYTASASGTYTVSHKLGGCTATSPGKAVTIFSCAPPPLRVPYSVTPTTATTASHGTDMTVTWDVSTCASTGYHILYGLGSGLASWTLSGSKCAVGTSGTYNWTGVPDPSGDASRFLWFVVVGDNGAATEGSWGLTSSSTERGGASASGQCGMTTKDTSTACGTP